MSVPVRVELGPRSSVLHEELSAAWARCLVDTVPPDAATLRFPDQAAHEITALPSKITTEVTMVALAALRGSRLLFHAAALSDPGTGQACVLVAPSGTGKTHAARTLGRSLEYLGDEAVCIDPQELVITAYPKPLAIRTDSNPHKAQVSPDRLGLLSQTRPARMRCLLVLDRDPLATGVEVSKPVPLARALVLLTPNISSLALLPQPLTTLLRVIEQVGGVRVVHYREIHAAAQHLMALTRAPVETAALPSQLTSWAGPSVSFATSQPPHDVASPPPETTGGSGRTTVRPAGERVEPAPWVEAVENPEDPSQLFVMLSDQVVTLGPLASQVWHECRQRGPRTRDQLHRALVQFNGEPQDAVTLVEQCVSALLNGGILRPTDEG